MSLATPCGPLRAARRGPNKLRQQRRPVVVLDSINNRPLLMAFAAVSVVPGLVYALEPVKEGE